MGFFIYFFSNARFVKSMPYSVFLTEIPTWTIDLCSVSRINMGILAPLHLMLPLHGMLG